MTTMHTATSSKARLSGRVTNTDGSPFEMSSACRVLLDQRPEHEGEQQRRRLELPFREGISRDPEGDQHEDVDRAVVKAVDADAQKPRMNR